MLLQLGYILFLVHFKVYRERKEYLMELCNELVVLLTNYGMLLILDDFILSSWATHKMAYFLIGICILNFVVNFGPLLYQGIKNVIIYCRKQ